MMPSDSDFPKCLWLVGCGGMGGAMLARWLDSGMPVGSVAVIDPEPRGLPQAFSGSVFATPAAALAAGSAPEVVMLGVKPQLLGVVAAGFPQNFASPPLLVSMLAGVKIGALAAAFPPLHIARIMPNTPARIGKGISALFGPTLGPRDQAIVEQLMGALGKTLWLEDEARFDAVTAVSGSGPAFLFRFIEALAGAGEAAGLDPQTAALLAFEAVVGAAALAADSGQTPATLRQQVTSPNGTTQAGLDVLDGDGALSSLMRATVRSAAERSRALAAAADAALDLAAQRETVKAD